MLSGSCGTRDEPYVPCRRADASVLKRGLSWGHLLNIYKLKATSCGLLCIRKVCPGIRVWNGMRFPLVAPLGNRIPLRPQIPGHIFRQAPQPETTSHSNGKFWGAFSGSPPIWKARPTLNTSSERMRACRPGRSRHRGDGKCHPKRLPSLRPRVSRKKPRGFRGFHFCIISHARRR